LFYVTRRHHWVTISFFGSLTNQLFVDIARQSYALFDFVSCWLCRHREVFFPFYTIKNLSVTNYFEKYGQSFSNDSYVSINISKTAKECVWRRRFRPK
jgi:hypothetical protein